MEIKDLLVPGISAVLAIGASMATVTATAQNADELADELADRVRNIEVKQAGEESTKVMVEQNTERLERLESIVEKIAEAQLKTLQNQARMCEKLDADCK
tara:strand:- start:250 stop:549 length:300 start_codon:yes stop_codon:yes gene_type:complete